MRDAPKTLLLYGDSNTHGTMPLRALGQLERHPIDQRWPQQLAKSLSGRDWRVLDDVAWSHHCSRRPCRRAARMGVMGFTQGLRKPPPNRLHRPDVGNQRP